jgi:hypothetical protein
MHSAPTSAKQSWEALKAQIVAEEMTGPPTSAKQSWEALKAQIVAEEMTGPAKEFVSAKEFAPSHIRLP